MGLRYGVATLAVVLGAGSLIAFGVLLASGSLGLVQLHLSEPVLLAWNSALCLLFFLQHSGMVRRPFQEWMGKRVPKRWLGVIYTIVSAAALLALVVLWQPSAVRIYALEGPWRWLPRTILLLCLGAFLWAVRALGAVDLFGTKALVSDRQAGQDEPAALIIKGPYRWVRHPFYFLAIVIYWATPVLSLDRLLLNILFTAWTVLGARWEERDLLAAFGESYRSYRQEVPRKGVVGKPHLLPLGTRRWSSSKKFIRNVRLLAGLWSAVPSEYRTTAIRLPSGAMS